MSCVPERSAQSEAEGAERGPLNQQSLVQSSTVDVDELLQESGVVVAQGIRQLGREREEALQEAGRLREALEAARQESQGAAEVSTALSQEVAALHGEVERLKAQQAAAVGKERARAERLARAVRSESEKREASQDKGRRLMAERLNLEAEVVLLRVKRRRTAATFRAIRATLAEERAVAAIQQHHRKAAEAELAEVRHEAEALLAQGTHSALWVARLAWQVEVLRLQLQAVEFIRGEEHAAAERKQAQLQALLRHEAAEREAASMQAQAIGERAGELEGRLVAVETREARLQEQLQEAQEAAQERMREAILAEVRRVMEEDGHGDEREWPMGRLRNAIEGATP